ncbi:30S ribosomal protein S6 [candidate division KSB1 bacterium]|nr:30S ribosomal protein S6 [candidate division KSB1 bacterium]
MKAYETVFIIDSLIKNEEIEGIISKIEKFITNNGGQIETIERWGKKRLNYEIKKRQYGFYVLIKYQAANKLNRLLEREYQLDENILRYLVIYLDPKAAKPAQVSKPAAIEGVRSDLPFEDNPVIPEAISTIVTEPDASDVVSAPESEQ